MVNIINLTVEHSTLVRFTFIFIRAPPGIREICREIGLSVA